MVKPVVVLGVFNADTTYRADRFPRTGETLLGRAFSLGPGGKGSNQAVAAARAGAPTRLVTRLGRDTFAEMALKMWREAGVVPSVRHVEGGQTGAALIFVDDRTGDNSIIICPGVGQGIGADDIAGNADLIRGAGVFLTQLEQPVDAAWAGLRMAREAAVVTILNPAPATPLPDGMLALCDYVTPNESEAETLTGAPVDSLETAKRAAAHLRGKGAGTAIVTLGGEGLLFDDGRRVEHLPALNAGPVAETTGAGDAFNGGFAAGLAHGMEPLDAARFGTACAAISVTRPGCAPSMPVRADIVALLERGA